MTSEIDSAKLTAFVCYGTEQRGHWRATLLTGDRLWRCWRLDGYHRPVGFALRVTPQFLGTSGQGRGWIALQLRRHRARLAAIGAR